MFALAAWFLRCAGTLATESSDGRLSRPLVPVAHFTDVASKAGMIVRVILGGETTGTGVAIFDYDNDGGPDIFVVNGTKLEGLPLRQDAHKPSLPQQPRSHFTLQKNQT